jgi:transcriptional regulator with XRE-family HTH domain
MKGEEAFGRLFRELRVRQGKTLRQFCLDNGFDAGNISKLERGILAPPESHAKLAEYACALGLVEGDDDWYEFFDKAAIARGRIPPGVLTDEQLLTRLPIVFRTLRGQRVSPESVDELVEFIRRHERGC